MWSQELLTRLYIAGLSGLWGVNQRSICSEVICGYQYQFKSEESMIRVKYISGVKSRADDLLNQPEVKLRKYLNR